MPAGRELDDRLVVEDELARSATARCEVGRQLWRRDHRVVHLGLEHDDAALAARLRRVHRDVGVAQQLVGGVDARRRPAAMPMLARTSTSLAVDRERRARAPPISARPPRSDAFDVRRVLEQDRELVAAQPGGQCRSGAGADCEPLGDRDQQRVAGGVAEAVVDRLEVVEVEEQDDRRRGPPGRRDSSRGRRSGRTATRLASPVSGSW